MLYILALLAALLALLAALLALLALLTLYIALLTMLIVAATLAALLALLTTYIALLTIVILMCGAEGRAVGERQTSGSDAGSDRGRRLGGCHRRHGHHGHLLVYEALELLVYEAVSVTDDMGITVSY